MRRGSLRPPSEAPATGERFETLLGIRNLVVEQILRGAANEPVDHRQESDEWVVVLAGAAVLEVEGERLDLGPGYWVFLPARTPHRVVGTVGATSWLAVHLAPDPPT